MMERRAYVVIAVLYLATIISAHPQNRSRPVRFWSRPALNLALIDQVNQRESNSWTAGVNERFRTATLHDVRAMLGAQLGTARHLPLREAPAHQHLRASRLPAAYDVRTEWGELCPTTLEVRDQSQCGACWAFGAAEVMSDRVCIATDGARTPHLSATDLLACCGTCGLGCQGGQPSAAFVYWLYTGLVTGGNYTNATNFDNGCFPYPFPPCEHHTNGTHYPPCDSTIFRTPTCPHHCDAHSSARWSQKSRARRVYRVEGETNSMAELMAHGPLEVDFEVFEDLLAYKSGVYQHVGSGEMLGGHAVKLVGWGEQNGIPYWTIVNSWNEDWGDHGTFKIRRGHNECGIENDVIGGLPLIEHEEV